VRRYLRPIVVTLLLAYLGALGLPLVWNRVKTGGSRLFFGNPQSLADSPNISLVFTVKRDQWLTFELPEAFARLRIISNAHIPSMPSDPLLATWKYGLHYQLLRKDKTLLRDGLYLHRSNLPLTVDASGKSTSGEFYLQANLLPLADQSAILAWEDLKEAAYLRIGFESEHPEINEVAIRTYTPSKISPHRLASEWLRLNNEQQDKLASGSIYPASLLSEFEKQNLLKHQWHPIGPEGIEGRDYGAKSLYTLKDFEPQQLGIEFVAAGLQANQDSPGVLIIPKPGGKLLIELKTLDGNRPQGPVDLTIKGYGDQPRNRWQRRVTWREPMKDIALEVMSGMLEVTSSQAVVITASLENQQLVTDITPKPITIKTYTTLQDLDFEILHFQQQPAVTRVDVRKTLPRQPTATPSSVAYEGLDASQKVVKQGSLRVPDLPSIYDRLANDDVVRISDPISYYLTLPPEVRSLRLKSSSPNLLINAYNQPANFVRAQKVPEDTSLSADRKNLQRSWFPLLAINDHALFEKQQIKWVEAQPRPPIDDENLLRGIYASRHFTPEGNHETRTILVAVEDTPSRDEMLPNLYCGLSLSSEVKVDIKGAANLQSIAPELIFLRNGTAPFDFRLDIDRQRRLATSAMGRQGVIRLPALATGRHSMRLDSPSGGQWLMNYQNGCNNKRYLMRRVYKLNRQELTFIVQHKAGEDETLNGRFFVSSGARERSVLDVSIEPVSVNHTLTPDQPANWTFNRHSYDIHASNEHASPVLYSEEQLNQGENVFIPLNGDLPPGSYRVKIKLKNGPEGYVGLSQLDPGLHEQHKLNREIADESR
jgi:hypothetical protein